MNSIESIRELYKEKAFEQIILFSDEIIQGDNEESKNIYGLCLLQLKKYTEAVQFFTTLAEKEEKQIYWFQVCTACVALKNIEQADKAFQKAMTFCDLVPKKGKDEKPQQLMQPQSLSFHYMCMLTDGFFFYEAFLRADKLKNNYKSIFITTNAFTLSKGLPAFSNYLKVLKAILIELEDKEKVNLWLADFISGIDENGKNLIKKLQKEIAAK